MSPDTEAQLLAGLNSLNEQMGTVREDLSTVRANQEAHSMMHELYSRTRSQTCPTEPMVRDCASNIDAIAGIQRNHGDRIRAAEGFIEAAKKAGIVSQERQRPVKWLMTNIDKVFWAAVAAAVIYVLIEH